MSLMKKTCIMSLTLAIILTGCGGTGLPAINPKTVDLPVVSAVGEKVGEAVTFSWENPDGTTETWKPERKTLLTFWVYGCSSCLPEFTAVQEFARQSKLDILVVNLNKVKDISLLAEMLTLLDEPPTVKIVLDPTSVVGKEFGVQTVPDAMIIDGNGRILVRQKARVDLQTLVEMEKESEVK